MGACSAHLFIHPYLSLPHSSVVFFTPTVHAENAVEFPIKISFLYQTSLQIKIHGNCNLKVFSLVNKNKKT